MAAPVILVLVQPRRVGDGAVQSVRLAGGGAARPYRYFGEQWRSGITGLPTFVCAIDYAGDDLGTGGVPQAAEIEWAPAAKADLAALAAYLWHDAPVSIYLGPEGTDPALVLQGKVLGISIENSKLKITLADPAADLRKPLLVDRFAGTDGLEGPVEWKGTIKRRAFGRVWNVKGDPIDKAHQIYCYADPTRPLQAISAVRDKGAAAASLTTVAWAGSAAATLAALQAAAAPPGGGVVAPSIACVKWWTQPAGDLCADLLGEIGSAYVETSAEIAQRLVQAIGGPSFAAGTVAAAAAARPAPVGYLAKDEAETVAAMLDRMLGDTSLLWVLSSAGEIVLRPWSWGASVAAARSHEVNRKAAYRPLGTRRIGYRHNENVMARGDIAAVVLSDGVSYLDGTSLEALKPAEAGATAGAPSGTAVGAIAADDVASTIKPGGGVDADQVGTDALTADAVTEVQQASSTSGATGAGLSTWTVLDSISMTLAHGGDIVTWATVRQAFSSGARQWAMQLLIDGTVVFDNAGSAFADSVAMSGKLTVAAGTYTIEIKWAAQDSTVSVPAGGASLIALRRYR